MYPICYCFYYCFVLLVAQALRNSLIAQNSQNPIEAVSICGVICPYTCSACENITKKTTFVKDTIFTFCRDLLQKSKIQKHRNC